MKISLDNELQEKITGTLINYYFVCHRKLWYFVNHIQMENNNQEVNLGKLIDDYYYLNEKKHLMINDTICVDFIGRYNVIHEVKKSRSLEDASEWQLKYYLYFFKKHGVLVEKGILNYPKLKKRVEVFLNENDERKLEEIISNIKKIKKLKIPDIINSKICKKCAYFELCYI